MLRSGAQKPILDEILTQAGFRGTDPGAALHGETRTRAAPATTEQPERDAVRHVETDLTDALAVPGVPVDEPPTPAVP